MSFGAMRWTVIVSADAGQSADFYKKVLGWQIWYDQKHDFDSRFHPVALPTAKKQAFARLVVMGEGPIERWYEDDNAPSVALMEYVDDDIGSSRSEPSDKLRQGDVVLMIQGQNPDEIYARAMENGARTSSAPCDWTVAHHEGIGDIGFRSASFFDPDGTYVEVSVKRTTP